MNEALPRWRSFSSDGENASEPPPREPEERGGRRWAGHPRLLAAAVLAVLGGVVLTAAIALAVISLTASPGSSRALAMGQPLDDLTSPAGDTSAVPDAGLSSGGTVSAEIIVDVGGAVLDPGLHRLHAGDRVGDAIAAAGGFGPRVDISAAGQTLNLAAELSDGAKILVPELGTRGPDSGGHGAAGDGRIDLNSADQGTLEELPGIGPVTARRIIEARAERRFASVDELLERGVVGEAVFQDIRELITAGG